MGYSVEENYEENEENVKQKGGRKVCNVAPSVSCFCHNYVR